MNTINMTIDASELTQALLKLTQALENFGQSTAAVNQAAPTPAAASAKAAQTPQKPSAAPVETPEATYTVEQVREALGSLSQAKGKAIARGILQQLGVRSVSDLEPGQFGQAMQLIEGANV